MRILVTGGAGFIGMNLIKKLLKNNHTVTSLDNYSTGFKSNEIKGCNYLIGDVNSIDLVGKNFNLCYHLAALPRIQPSFLNPKETFTSNTEGSLKVAEWAKKHNIKVIYSGSSSRWHNPYQSPYACFKHIGEEIFKLYKKVYDLDVEIARFYNVYGPGEIIDGDWAAVIGKWRKQVKEKKPITIVGDGKQRRDFTHVDDIVDALYKLGLNSYKHKDAWELGTGFNYSINEVYEMFRKKFNSECIYIPDQPGNYRKTLRENDDTLKVLNWNPKNRLKQYINSL